MTSNFFPVHGPDLASAGACPGGGQGAWPPPPLEIEKQKKVIRANFKLFHLYFATFLVENIIFSAIFWAGPPPLKNWKAKKKKKAFTFWAPPPPYEILDTRLPSLHVSYFCMFHCCTVLLDLLSCLFCGCRIEANSNMYTLTCLSQTRGRFQLLAYLLFVIF